ncbi:MAG: hypothetical protein ABSF35_16950 [Polyangia bacterium]
MASRKEKINTSQAAFTVLFALVATPPPPVPLPPQELAEHVPEQSLLPVVHVPVITQVASPPS